MNNKRTLLPNLITLFVFTCLAAVLLANRHVVADFITGGVLPAAFDSAALEHLSLIIAVLLSTILGLLLLHIRIGMIQTLGNVLPVNAESVGELALSREQFRTLYDTSPVPYFLIDDKGAIHDPNLATIRLLQGTAEECTAANLYAMLSDEKNKDAVTMLRTKVDRRVSVHNNEFQLQTLKGNTRWVLVSIYSLERSSRLPYSHLVTLIDLTDEREQEQIKTDFLLLASHQLRTPLTTIKWHVDYLLTTKTLEVSPEVHTYLGEVYVGCQRMIDIISTLLTVSRIEMGTLAPECGSVSVREIVQDLLLELIGDMKKKDILPEFTISGDDMITTDGTMLRIALHNLLTNATKYTAKGGTITISCTFTDDGGDISVADTGHGIPADEQVNIFKKLYRASNAKKISANGTGLGLFLTKSFIEKLGGSISFTSVEGKGSTFTLHVPRIAPCA